MIKLFLKDDENTENYPTVGVIGIAGPIFNNTVTIIANLDWPVTSGDDLAKELGFKKFVFLNDFVINGYGILSKITEGVDYERINNNKVDTKGPIAMIGAGTGLGHGYLLKHQSGKYYHVFPSEGGHQDFAPQSDLEWRYLTYLKEHYKISHVSVERACAGPAIPVILQFLIQKEGMISNHFKSYEEINKATSEDIIQLGLNKNCIVCEKVVEFFVTIYGAAAGNMSLLILPTGGLYLLGGLSVALTDYMIKSDVFRVSLY
jgi:glucokinase